MESNKEELIKKNIKVLQKYKYLLSDTNSIEKLRVLSKSWDKYKLDFEFRNEDVSKLYKEIEDILISKLKELNKKEKINISNLNYKKDEDFDILYRYISDNLEYNINNLENGIINKYFYKFAEWLQSKSKNFDLKPFEYYINYMLKKAKELDKNINYNIYINPNSTKTPYLINTIKFKSRNCKLLDKKECNTECKWTPGYLWGGRCEFKEYFDKIYEEYCVLGSYRSKDDLIFLIKSFHMDYLDDIENYKKLKKSISTVINLDGKSIDLNEYNYGQLCDILKDQLIENIKKYKLDTPLGRYEYLNNLNLKKEEIEKLAKIIIKSKNNGDDLYETTSKVSSFLSKENFKILFKTIGFVIIVIIIINTIFDSNWDLRTDDQIKTYVSDTLDYYQRHGTAWYNRNLSDIPYKIQDYVDYYTGARSPEDIESEALIRTADKTFNNGIERISNWGIDTINKYKFW